MIRNRRAFVALLASTLGAGCVFDKITLPAGAPRVVVHGVLNPGVTDQVILVERALTGTTGAARAPYDSVNPIVSDGGTPITGARVVIKSAQGDSVELREDRTVRADGRGAGVYRFANSTGVATSDDFYPRLVVAAGGTYRLQVTTPDGERVTGSTTVPAIGGRSQPPVLRQFERDRDSLFLGWPSVGNSAAYEVRVESAHGPYVAFVDSLEYLLAGSLTHTRVAGRPRVFWPGFRQSVTVSAVDANYHDYYRAGSDAITARGLLVRLQGGVGVFGSIARVQDRLIAVVGAGGEAPAGRWVATGGVPAGQPESFVLFPESSAVGATLLTGFASGIGPADGAQVVARHTGNTLSVAMLARQSLRDTVVAFSGRFQSGSGNTTFTATVSGGTQSLTYRLTAGGND